MVHQWFIEFNGPLMDHEWSINGLLIIHQWIINGPLIIHQLNVDIIVQLS